MNCEKYKELILFKPDGELTQDEHAALEAHIAVCPSCRRLYDSVSALSAELNTAPEFPAGLHADIMSAVRRDKRARKPMPIRFRGYIAAAACFAVVVAAAGISLGGFFRCGSAAPQDNFTAAADAASAEAPSHKGGFFAEDEAAAAGSASVCENGAHYDDSCDGSLALVPSPTEAELLPDIAEARLHSVTAKGESDSSLSTAEAQIFLDALFNGGLNENDAVYTLYITESGGDEYVLYLRLSGGVITMSLTPDDPEPVPVASVLELTELINVLK